MTTNEQIEKHANRIADAIVELVERCDGPVMLSRITREIPGFGTDKDPSWAYTVEHNEVGERTIWDGMTAAGRRALTQVIRGRRVAVQFVSALLYILEGCSINEHCLPIVLLPARAANLETPVFPLLRVKREVRATAKKRFGNRLLTPGSVRATADCFSPV
jgi:hypothetical protein